MGYEAASESSRPDRNVIELVQYLQSVCEFMKVWHLTCPSISRHRPFTVCVFIKLENPIWSAEYFSLRFSLYISSRLANKFHSTTQVHITTTTLGWQKNETCTLASHHQRKC